MTEPTDKSLTEIALLIRFRGDQESVDLLRAYVRQKQFDAWAEGWTRCADMVQDDGEFEDYYVNPYKETTDG